MAPGLEDIAALAGVVFAGREQLKLWIALSTHMPTSEYIHPDKEDGSVSAAQYEPNPNSSPGSANRKRIAMGLCILSAQLVMLFVLNFVTSAAFLTVFLTVLYAIFILVPTHSMVRLVFPVDSCVAIRRMTHSDKFTIRWITKETDASGTLSAKRLAVSFTIVGLFFLCAIKDLVVAQMVVYPVVVFGIMAGAAMNMRVGRYKIWHVMSFMIGYIIIVPALALLLAAYNGEFSGSAAPRPEVDEKQDEMVPMWLLEIMLRVIDFMGLLAATTITNYTMQYEYSLVHSPHRNSAKPVPIPRSLPTFRQPITIACIIANALPLAMMHFAPGKYHISPGHGYSILGVWVHIPLTVLFALVTAGVTGQFKKYCRFSSIWVPTMAQVEAFRTEGGVIFNFNETAPFMREEITMKGKTDKTFEREGSAEAHITTQGHQTVVDSEKQQA